MSAAPYDAVVIGAGINGLAAAAYAARAGKRVLVVEARNKIGGLCDTARFGEHFRAPVAAHVLHALDPHVVSDLGLTRHGLKFAVRDMPLVGLRSDGRHIVLSRDAAASMRSISIHARADADAFIIFRQELFAMARAARRLWWERTEAGGERAKAKLARLAYRSVSAWLDSWFEDDALKSLLAFDGTAGGASPLEPGSSLQLVWRAAQEMCGLQGAAAFPVGGPGALAEAVLAAAQAAGAEVRTGAPAERIHANGAVVAVKLASGETLACRAVLSSLSRRKTLIALAGGASTGFSEAAALERTRPRVGAAKVLLALNAPPPFAGVSVPLAGRFIVCEQIDGLASAHARARAGELPAEPAMEIVVPSAADAGFAPPGQHVLSVLVRPVPLSPKEGWPSLKSKLVERAIIALERHASGLVRHITAAEALTPAEIEFAYGAEDELGGAVTADRMLSPWASRIKCAIAGLYLCGASAEPVGAISGRAGRIAAAMLTAEQAR